MTTFFATAAAAAPWMDDWKKLQSVKKELLATEGKDSQSHKYVKKGLDEPIKNYGA